MKTFLDKVGNNMERRISSISEIKDDQMSFWSQILLGFIQFKGLQNGYKYHMTKYNQSSKHLSIGEHLILQADGEVPEFLSI